MWPAILVGWTAEGHLFSATRRGRAQHGTARQPPPLITPKTPTEDRMKTSVLLASLVAAVALAACGKKEEAAAPAPAAKPAAAAPAPAPAPAASAAPAADAASAAMPAASK